MLSIKIHFKYKDLGRLKVKEWIKIHHDNTNQKKFVIVTILISDKASFRTRLPE